MRSTKLHIPNPLRARPITGARLALLLGLAMPLAPAHAEDVVVSSYPAAPNSWPFLVGLKMDFFKQAGADVTGVRSTGGGGQDIRNLVAGDLAYADGGLAPIIAAIQQGVEIKIVAENIHGSATVSWVTLPNSSIKGPKDLKGTKMAFTSPQSVTEGFERFMLRKLGYAENDVTLVAAGGFPQSLTLLETGAVNVAVITEPTISTNNGKYRTVIAGWDASIFPATTSTLGISPIKMIKERPQFIRGVIAGRRLAVDYMASHRDEAAALIGAANKLETPVVRSMLDRLIDQGTSEGVPVFATGRIYPNALENTIQMLRTIGAVQGEVDLAKMIDESLLPDDQKSTKK